MTYQDFRIVPVRFEGGPLNGDLNELDYAEHELQEMLDRDEPWDFTSGHPERGPGRHDRAVPARAPARRPVGVRACRHVRAPRRGAQLHCRVLRRVRDGLAALADDTPAPDPVPAARPPRGGLVMANEGTARPPLSPVELARSCQPQPGLRRERHSGAWQFRPAVPQQAMPVAGRQGGRS